MSDKTTEEHQNRRPLAVRQVGLATSCARWLSNKNITPNQISIASIGFALMAALCLLAIPMQLMSHWLITLLAALFIQCRLLCNLFDGMVAVEGGKSTPAGELFNDIPDRIADPLILVAAGYAAIDFNLGITLGWFAGVLAVMTAYIRTLAASINAPVNFQGPMAKQHRMATITIACVLTSVESFFVPAGSSLMVALVVIILGCLVTCFNRAKSAYDFLENSNNTQKNTQKGQS